MDRSTYRPSPPRRSVKRSDVIAREIVEEILAGGLQAGDVLPPEGVMLSHYEVGRASLREALRLLESQGLVTLKTGPGGGPVVGEVDAANLGRTATLFFRLAGATCGVLAEAMLLLDPWLAELAASRAQPRAARVSLGTCVAAADQSRDDSAAVWMTAPEFHDAIYRLSGNGVLETLASAVGAIFRSQVLSQVDMSECQPAFLAHHHQLADAISAGEPSVARRLAYDHMESIVNTVSGQSPWLLERVIEWR
jgi:DNA-binding FadR family transcriptional regulator